MILGGVAGLGGDRDVEHRCERVRLLLGAHVLRDLPVVDQALVEPARLAAGDDARRDVGLRVAGLEVGSGDPAEVDARQLHLVGEHHPPLGGDLRSGHVDRLDVRALGQGAEVLLDLLLGPGDVDVADHRERRVVGRVVA